MSRPTGPERRVTVEFRRPGGLPALAEGVRRLRSVAERLSAVRETEQALLNLPRSALRRLAMITIRCSGKDNDLLVRVVRIPRHLPSARYDRYLVMPSASATYTYGDQRITEPAWFLSDLKPFVVQCRCLPRPVTLTREHLRGESPPPPGVRVCINPGVRVLES